jgi:hypothetical protein
MIDKRQRMADYITRRAFPDLTTTAKPPTRPTFLEWSRKTERTPFVPKDTTPRLGIVTRLMACVYPWREIEIEVGEPFASITFNRPTIRHPEPFGPNGLTDACRAFIIEAVEAAVEHDGYRRSITWPNPPLTHHREPA